MKTSKWPHAVLVAVLLLGGPLLPLTALAQMQPPAPPPPPPTTTAPYEPTRNERIGADVLNVVYVPGKAILCGAGTAAGAVIMILSFGSGYRPAVNIFREGCGGPWLLTPYDVAGKRTPDERY